MRNLFFLLLGVVLVCVLAGCQRLQRVSYYHSRQPDPSGWRVDRPLLFFADSATAPGLESGQYHLYMVMRYSNSYPYSKLHLRLEYTSLARGVRFRDICVDMEHPAFNSGAKVKLNKGLIELIIPLGYDFVDQGWSLGIQQRMAPPPVTGINDIGIKMVKG